MENKILNNLEEKISDILKELKNKANNKEFFDKFVSNLKIKNIDGNTIYLLAKNNFAKQVIISDYLNEITQELNKLENTNYSIEIVTDVEGKITASKIDYKPSGKVVGLNKNYSFSTLVVGVFNKAAVLAGKNVVTENFISPLFITSSVGLGKTHLLHAIGNEFVTAFPNKNVKYVSSDDFSREIYQGLISDDKNLLEQIKDEYNSYDLLLIDDIQILANRTKINEILFGIFNNALRDGKYIVFTSDKNIDLLSGFEERMKSRFHSGITLTIQKPEMENIIEIIKQKITKLGGVYKLSDDSINFIARRNTNDIRRLEGDINQILFYAANNLPKFTMIDFDTVKNVLSPSNNELINNFGYDIDPNIVIDEICATYGVKSEMVKSKAKTKHLITPRSVCMYVLRQKFNMTYSQIGQLFSGRDHSTVMSAIEKVEKIIKSDNELNTLIENVYKKM